MSIGKHHRNLRTKHSVCNTRLEERIVTYNSDEGEESEFIIFCPNCDIEVEEDSRNTKRDKKPKIDREIRRRRSYDEWN